MKRTSFMILVVATISMSISFASAKVCVDLSSNLSRGQESSHVLTLQNFLVQKGLLASQPNGYFGPNTARAVKAYQKSVGIIQTGSVYTLTRAALKNETCSATAPLSLPENAPITSSNQSSVSSQMGMNSPVFVLPNPALQPTIDSIDKVTFVSRATMEAPLTIHGTNFSTSSNTVLLKGQGSNKAYTVGTFASSDRITLIVNSTFTSILLSCGVSCMEYLPVGKYDVIVKNQAGESNSGYISINSVTSSSVSGTLNTPIPSGSTQARLGAITFGTSFPSTLEDITLTLSGEVVNKGSIGNFQLKDEITGAAIGGSGTFNLNHELLVENQSKIYTLYGDVDVLIPGQVSFEAVVTVKDFIGNNLVHVKIPVFMATVLGHY